MPYSESKYHDYDVDTIRDYSIRDKYNRGLSIISDKSRDNLDTVSSTLMRRIMHIREWSFIERKLSWFVELDEIKNKSFLKQFDIISRDTIDFDTANYI